MRGLLGLYSLAFVVSAVTFVLSIFATVRTDWIVFSTPSTIPVKLTTSYGLFEKCDTSSYLPGLTQCRKFPLRDQDCGANSAGREAADIWLTSSGEVDEESSDERWDACDSWITAGLTSSSPRSYAQQLSLVFAVASLVAVVVTLIGTATVGRGFRTDKLRSGWKLVAWLMALQALCLILSSSLIAYERDHDPRFAHGSHLARSWQMTTAAYALNLGVVATLLFVRATGKLRIVPGDSGYTPIFDRE
ncbi:hypothetical protein JCM8097_000427 [Rhodosporidiobolus ruineniae]